MVRMESRRGKWRGILIFFFMTFILLLFLSAFFFFSTTASKEIGWLELRRSSSMDSYIKVAAETRRVLMAGGGPGSYPPQCMAKCGDCTPCLPIRVSVPPGTPVATEYYPEAWRCKCGNRLFMP